MDSSRSLTEPWPLQVINFFAGSLAGALTATFVCPLDVLKTRLQVQRKVEIVEPRYRGISGKLCVPLLESFCNQEMSLENADRTHSM